MPGLPREGSALIEDWPLDGFEARLLREPRVMMLFHASWCPFSRTFLDDFEAESAETDIPFARADLRHPLDPRWDDHHVRVVPTVAFFDHGEELDRAEALRGRGLDRRALAQLVWRVEGIERESLPGRKAKAHRATRRRSAR